MMPRARRVVLHGSGYKRLSLALGCHALGAWSLTFLAIIVCADRDKGIAGFQKTSCKSDESNNLYIF